MKEKGIAVTYDEYRKGAKQVAGLGRLSCYKGLDYLIKLLEQDNYYSEELEDTVVFIESHINHIEKENQKYKEVFDKINVFLDNHDKNAGKLYYKYDNKYLLSEIKEDIRDILKEVK